MKKFIAFKFNPGITTLIDSNPDDLILELLRTTKGPVCYLGNAVEGSFLVNDYASYVSNFNFKSLKPTINNTHLDNAETIIIKVDKYSDYNTIETLNKQLQEASNGNSPKHFIIVIDTDEHCSGRETPSFFSRVITHRKPPTNIQKSATPTPQYEVKENIPVELYDLLHKSKFDSTNQQLDFQNIFQETIKAIVEKHPGKSLHICFRSKEITPEYLTIIASLNMTKRLDQYHINLETYSNLFFSCEAMPPQPISEQITSCNFHNQFLGLDTEISLDNVIEITDSNVLHHLENHPDLTPNGTHEFELRYTEKPNTIYIATKLELETVESILNWLTSNRSRQCILGSPWCLGQTITTLNTFSSCNKQHFSPATITCKELFSTDTPLCQLDENGNPSQIHKGIFLANKFNFLVTSIIDIGNLRTQLLQFKKSTFYFSTAAYNMLTAEGPCIDRKNIKIIEPPKNVIDYINNKIPYLKKYCSDTVIMRVANLISKGFKIESAIAIGLLRGLPNLKIKLPPSHSMNSYIYTENGLKDLIDRSNYTNISKTGAVSKSTTEQHQEIIRCIEPLNSKNDFQIKSRLDAGGVLMCPVWIKPTAIKPHIPDQKEHLNIQIHAMIIVMKKSIENRLIIGRPQENMIRNRAEDLVLIREAQQHTSSAIIPNTRLNLGASGTGKDELCHALSGEITHTKLICQEVFDPLQLDKYKAIIKHYPKNTKEIGILNLQEVNLTDDHMETFEELALYALTNGGSIYIDATANDYKERASLSTLLKDVIKVNKVKVLSNNDIDHAFSRFLKDEPENNNEKIMVDIVRNYSDRKRINYRLIKSLCDMYIKHKNKPEFGDILKLIFDLKKTPIIAPVPNRITTQQLFTTTSSVNQLDTTLKPTLLEKNTNFLVTTLLDSKTFKSYQSASANSHYYMTPSVYADLFRKDLSLDVHNITVIDTPKELILYIKENDPNLEPYLSDIVLMRVSRLMSCSYSIEEAIEIGIKRGLPSVQSKSKHPVNTSDNSLNTYVYTNKGLKNSIHKELYTKFSSISEIVQRSKSSTTQNIRCIEPINSNNQTHMKEILNAGGLFMCPVWVDETNQLSYEQSESLVLAANKDTITHAITDLTKRVKKSPFIGAPQKQVITLLAEDLFTIRFSKQKQSKYSVRNTRLLVEDADNDLGILLKKCMGEQTNTQLLVQELFDPTHLETYKKLINEQHQSSELIGVLNLQQLNNSVKHMTAFEDLVFHAISTERPIYILASSNSKEMKDLPQNLKDVTAKAQIEVLSNEDIQKTISNLLEEEESNHNIETISTICKNYEPRKEITFQRLIETCEMYILLENKLDFGPYLKQSFKLMEEPILESSLEEGTVYSDNETNSDLNVDECIDTSATQISTKTHAEATYNQYSETATTQADIFTKETWKVYDLKQNERKPSNRRPESRAITDTKKNKELKKDKNNRSILFLTHPSLYVAFTLLTLCIAYYFIKNENKQGYALESNKNEPIQEKETKTYVSPEKHEYFPLENSNMNRKTVFPQDEVKSDSHSKQDSTPDIDKKTTHPVLDPNNVQPLPNAKFKNTQNTVTNIDRNNDTQTEKNTNNNLKPKEKSTGPQEGFNQESDFNRIPDNEIESTHPFEEKKTVRPELPYHLEAKQFLENKYTNNLKTEVWPYIPVPDRSKVVTVKETDYLLPQKIECIDIPPGTPLIKGITVGTISTSPSKNYNNIGSVSPFVGELLTKSPNIIILGDTSVFASTLQGLTVSNIDTTDPITQKFKAIIDKHSESKLIKTLIKKIKATENIVYQANILKQFFKEYFKYEYLPKTLHPSETNDWVDYMLDYRVGLCAHFSQFAARFLSIHNPNTGISSVEVLNCDSSFSHELLLLDNEGTIEFFDVTPPKDLETNELNFETFLEFLNDVEIILKDLFNFPKLTKILPPILNELKNIRLSDFKQITWRDLSRILMLAMVLSIPPQLLIYTLFNKSIKKKLLTTFKKVLKSLLEMRSLNLSNQANTVSTFILKNITTGMNFINQYMSISLQLISAGIGLIPTTVLLKTILGEVKKESIEYQTILNQIQSFKENKSIIQFPVQVKERKTIPINFNKSGFKNYVNGTMQVYKDKTITISKNNKISSLDLQSYRLDIKEIILKLIHFGLDPYTFIESDLLKNVYEEALLKKLKKTSSSLPASNVYLLATDYYPQSGEILTKSQSPLIKFAQITDYSLETITAPTYQWNYATIFDGWKNIIQLEKHDLLNKKHVAPKLERQKSHQDFINITRHIDQSEKVRNFLNSPDTLKYCNGIPFIHFALETYNLALFVEVYNHYTENNMSATNLNGNNLIDHCCYQSDKISDKKEKLAYLIEHEPIDTFTNTDNIGIHTLIRLIRNCPTIELLEQALQKGASEKINTPINFLNPLDIAYFYNLPKNLMNVLISYGAKHSKHFLNVNDEIKQAWFNNLRKKFIKA
jgi:hypothetical protein